ncbi:cytochrome c oxidase assembly protein [Georgenia sp. MJ278]
MTTYAEGVPTPPENLRLPRAAVVAGALVGIVVLAVALSYSGATAPSLVLDPGALVRWGVPVATVVVDAATAVTIGALALCAVVLPFQRVSARAGTTTGTGEALDAGAPERAGAQGPSRERVSRAARDRASRDAVDVDGGAWRTAARVAAVGAGVWTLASLARLVLVYARTAGQPVGGADFGTGLAQFATEIPLGQNQLVATGLAALVAVAAVAVGSLTTAALVAALALGALVPIALTGHAAGAASHELAVSSLWLHVAGVSLWAGGLVVLCLVAPRLRGDLVASVTRYSTLAGWCFALVGLSGMINGWIRIGSLAGLGTEYGVLLLAKVAIFVALGLAGWAHRRTTIPRLAEVAPGRAARSWAFWRLAAGEVLLMGAVMGVAVALGSTAPPTPQEPVASPSPVHSATGHDIPPEPTALAWLTQVRPDILFALAALTLAGVYVAWVRRLRRRGDAWPVPRTAAWLVGCALFLWVTNGGPAVYGSILFSAHMLQHMLLVMVVPIFFVLGAPVTLALRALPRRGDGTRGPREWLLAIVHSRWAGFFANPIVAAVNFAGSMVVFYYSPLFELALTTHLGHVLMVVHFTLAGYMFANVLIGIDPGIRRPAYPLRLVMLFATMAFHAFFGIAVTMATTLFAADHFAGLGLPWRVDALADQDMGGAITWGIGEIPTLVLAVAVAVSWARDEERAARRGDRKADRDDDADLVAYNAQLARLADRDAR